MKQIGSVPQPSKSWIFFLIFLLLVFGLLAMSGTLMHLLTESWWFQSVGYGDVFWTRLKWQVGLWAVTLVAYLAFLGGNYAIAMRLTRDRPFYFLETSDRVIALQPIIKYAANGLILVLSLAAALNSVSAWETVLKFLNPASFGIEDPIYQQDVSFYFFRWPLYEAIQQGLLEILIWAGLLSLLIYALKGEIRPERGWKYFLTGQVKAHLCLLLAAIALVIAAGFWLQRYELLYSPTGVVFGAGYTDVHARLQAYWTMGFVTLAIAALFILSLWRSGFSLPVVGIVIYLIVLILINGLYPWFQQQFVVAPNELEKERPYIAHNLEFTRNAYSLDGVETQDFPAEDGLDQQALASNQSTLNNIRLWGYRPLLSTYRQLQEIRLYYRFVDVDIDRYVLDGDYRQVMLALRELDYSQVPQEAQTWVNQRLKYTHGYGLAMSPVNQVTSNGLPELFIKDIPPVSTVDLTIDQPRVYYGEQTDSYIFTGMSTPEFDYPLGDENAVNTYDGQGGIPIGSFWRRLAYAYDLGSFKILISNYFTDASRIHYYRPIQQRIATVAPFLQFDSDPYATVVGGRLKWIIDAYTVSNRYPYSEPLARSTDIESFVANDNLARLVRNDINYVRPSVKVVVDAYDGIPDFFVMDETDPVLASYRAIFPTLFKPLQDASVELRSHFRYPLDFFLIQSQIYKTYHMANPEVFYNREDLWRLPTQIYEGNPETMAPYYVIMRLPEAEAEEFILILPFTPVNKDNMVAWMAGRSDGENYGRLLLYEFPKQELVYGPSQIEARIDQNPEISEQLTLWSQEGSRVIRGDLLVIPINQSLLYVEPIYLRAEQGELPELTRVIVAYADQTAMAETLPEALNAIFGEAPAPSVTTTPPEPGIDSRTLTLAQAALEAYQRGQVALQQGNWQVYGQSQAELERILRELNQAE